MRLTCWSQDSTSSRSLAAPFVRRSSGATAASWPTTISASLAALTDFDELNIHRININYYREGKVAGDNTC